MKIFATLTLLLIAPLAIAVEPDRVHTGKVIEVSADRIVLDEAAGTVYIGFVGEDDALASVGKIRAGEEVRAVFGTTSNPEGRSINKLLSIRLCTEDDSECSADYTRQKIQEQQDAKKRNLAEQEQTLCRNAMQTTLSKDSRYIPENSIPVSDGYLANYNALTGLAKTCAAKLLKEHKASVLEACLLHHCGDDIGGGCWHIAGYATTSSAIQNATNKCSK